MTGMIKIMILNNSMVTCQMILFGCWFVVIQDLERPIYCTICWWNHFCFTIKYIFMQKILNNKNSKIWFKHWLIYQIVLTTMFFFPWDSSSRGFDGWWITEDRHIWWLYLWKKKNRNNWLIISFVADTKTALLFIWANRVTKLQKIFDSIALIFVFMTFQAAINAVWYPVSWGSTRINTLKPPKNHFHFDMLISQWRE